MSKKKKDHGYDISLEEAAGAHLVTWITGLMVFFVTLALTVNFGLSSLTKTWVTGLAGTLTVEMKPPLEEADGKPSSLARKNFENSVTQAMTFLKENTQVLEARILSEEEVKKLIEPWIGQSVPVESLPLPALIDIKVKPGADVAKLQSDLKTVAPAASIDTHTDTLDDVKALISTTGLFVWLLTSVIIALAVVSIAGIVKSKLMIHRAEVETLHLIGASDEYIASQFRRHTMRGTLRGAASGVIATFVTLGAIATLTHTLSSGVLARMSLSPVEWALLLVAPMAIGSFIAHLTAQAAALKELARLP